MSKRVDNTAQCSSHCDSIGNMIMMPIKLLSILILASKISSRSIFSGEEDRNLTEIFHSELELSSMKPLCDEQTSYIYPQFEINILGKKRKILQQVRIVKCLGLNADWALKNTVTPVCQQNFLEVKLFCIGKRLKGLFNLKFIHDSLGDSGFEEKETFFFPSGCNVIVA